MHDLYLELLDADPEERGPRRAGELRDERGVDRVTWWANLMPGRDELPMKVPDGRLLMVAETTESFAKPPSSTPTAVHFRRYPRPSQGCLTGRPTTGLLVVWISPKDPSLAQQVRDWADFVHIRHIASAGVPGYTQITPYDNAEPHDPRFMHFYEMDTDDPEGAYQLMPKLVAARLDKEEFARWADWRAAGAHIVYCNTFRWLGSCEA